MGKYYNSDLNTTATDMQSEDSRHPIPVDLVGIRGVKYPLKLRTEGGRINYATAELDMSVSLPAHVKGTHMSRFLQVLNEEAQYELDTSQLKEVTRKIQRRLEATDARMTLSFIFFLKKPAPHSAIKGFMDYKVTFDTFARGDEVNSIMEVVIPCTTVCPCSKEISDFGAHNQRSRVTVAIESQPVVWIEEIIAMAETAASAPVYSVLKREDEKMVTEQAYNNPKFVEDLVRELAHSLASDERTEWFKIDVQNHESIHNHDAFATITWERETNGTSAGTK